MMGKSLKVVIFLKNAKMGIHVFLTYVYETIHEVMYHHMQTFLLSIYHTLYHKLLGAFVSLRLASLISVHFDFLQIDKALCPISLNSGKNKVRRDPGYFLIA